MEHIALTVNVISAKNLEDVNWITRLKVYVVVSLSGDVPSTQEFKTVVDKTGGRNPSWNCPMKFNVNGHAGKLLVFSLCTERALGDRIVGKVTVPITELLQSAGKGVTYAHYQVTKPPGKTCRGELYFSYQFEEKIRIDFVDSSPAASEDFSYCPTPASEDWPHHPYHKDVYPPPPTPLQFPPPISSSPPSIPYYVPLYPPPEPHPVYEYSTHSAYWLTPYPPI